MKIVVNMHEAKTQLSKLVERARKGEEIIIAKDGKPVVRLVPVAPAGREGTMGLYAGKIAVHEDFNAPLPEEFTGTKE
jgi:prevent-host-death family protein